MKIGDEAWKELTLLKIELKHKSLAETISYLLYELNKPSEKSNAST